MDNMGQGNKRIRFKPGDFIYIPKGMDHNTEVLMPRASVSFGLEKND